MADIEIVVKLSDKDCENLKRFGALWVESENGSSIVSKALLEGTILPKGHGRIGDLDAISLDDINFFSIGDYHKMVRKLADEATIIEADKSESEV